MGTRAIIWACAGLAAVASLVPGPVAAQVLKAPDKTEGQRAAGATRNEIRLNRPVGEPASPTQPPSGVVTRLDLDEMLKIATEAGLIGPASAVDAQKERYLHGTYEGVVVEIFGYLCEGTCENFDLFAYFGKQDGVDDAFINAFNSRYIVKLTRAEGSVTMSYAIRLQGGVTREHVKWQTAVFLDTIKKAMAFKPS